MAKEIANIFSGWNYPIDQTGIKERVARLNKRSIKKRSKVEALKMALSMVDLTTLEGMDTEGKVIQLCQKAKRPHVELPDLPTVAAVCVYPPMVAIAKKQLKGSGINVASVATAFPSGMADRKSTRLNSSHVSISYAVCCLKKKKMSMICFLC